jgi:hypothetical protein
VETRNKYLKLRHFMFPGSHHLSNKPVKFCLSATMDMAVRCRVFLSTILQHNCTSLSKLLLFACVQNRIFYTVLVRLKQFSLAGRQCVQYQRQTEINKGQTLRFLGAFVQPRKSPVGFVMSLCPYVRKYQRGSYWTNIREI